MKKSIKFPLFTVIMILLASSCIQWIATPVHAESQVDNWSMFNHDLAHTGSSTSITPTTNQTLWTFTTGGAVETSPAVVNGIVYVGSDDGCVYALNAANGALIWNYSTGGPVQSSPAVVDGVVYVGGFHSHAVFALNASTGKLIWSTPTTSVYPNKISSTAVANGLVYVNVDNMGVGGELYAFNASTGNLAWKYTPGDAWLPSSPAVYGGKVYFGTTSEVVALDATSGKPSWSYFVVSNGPSSNGGSVIYFGASSLSISDGLVYIGTTNQTVQAWNASTGAFVWSGNIKGAVYSSTIAVANGVVYASTTWGGTLGTLQPPGVTALNAKSGALLWNHSVGSIQYSSPAVANDVVFVGSDDTVGPNLNPSLPEVTDGHNIYALNAKTGSTIWTYTTGGTVYSPAVAYGVVYVGSNDGKVYAIGTSQNTIPSPASSPSVPEFPSWIILPTLLIMMTMVTLIPRKKASLTSKRQ
jgi:outer membrane protein assembly factor BamB